MMKKKYGTTEGEEKYSVYSKNLFFQR